MIYVDEGNGPAIVLVHGWALDLTMWDLVASALRSRYRVIRYDRRGFGGSTELPDLQRDADDMITLLDRLAVTSAVVAGMSQGARVALQAAANHPPRVAALVLDGAPPEAPEIPLAAWRDLLRDHGIAAVRAGIRSHPLLRLAGSSPQARAILDAMIERYTGADLLHADSNAASDLGALAAAISCPTLILTGELDSAPRLQQAQRLHQSMRDAVRRTVPLAGHLAALDNPAAYVELLVGFLDTVAGYGSIRG